MHGVQDDVVPVCEFAYHLDDNDIFLTRDVTEICNHYAKEMFTGTLYEELVCSVQRLHQRIRSSEQTILDTEYVVTNRSRFTELT